MGLIEKIKSNIIKGELIKQVQGLDAKQLALMLHNHLDILMEDKDILTVKLEIVKKMEELKSELIQSGS